jgi:hypothetical protein
MYAAVPITAPVRVMLVTSAAVAMPRSASFARPSASSSTLAGFTSRWKTPCSCA